MTLDDTDPGTTIGAELQAVLNQARTLGFLGPGPVAEHVRRALDLAEGAGRPPGRALDLGSGGGVPGLPLMLLWPRCHWVLVEVNNRRSDFLRQSLVELGLDERAGVRAERAEVAARSELRGTFDLVVARGFAGPAVSAECGSPFLRPGGRMIVSEPPGGEPSRWDTAGLRQLGMLLGPTCHSPTAYQVLIQDRPCPHRYPRRVAIPSKRPLW